MLWIAKTIPYDGGRLVIPWRRNENVYVVHIMITIIPKRLI